MSCAKIGSSAVADEKNVAKKSSSIVERMIGAANTNRSPSRTACQLTSGTCAASRGGMSLIIASAAITHPNDTALMAYTHPTPSVAITMPPSDGPATDAS